LAPYAVKTAPLVIKTDLWVKPEHGARWRRPAKFHRETLHGRERRLAKIGAELKRIRECVGLPQSVVEEAEALVKKYFEVVAGFPPEVVAVAVLWTAAKAAGVPRPLEDFLRCSRAEERRVRRVAWRLKEVMKLGGKPSIEDYVGTLAARVDLLRLWSKPRWSFWRRIGSFCLAKTRGFLRRRRRCGWRR
jgi:transcription initiation factor TFIIIB Brf1 subunit/transcription initiation factor TFIIB